MGTLIVIRHSKTEPAAATDYVRALTSRGRADATAAGKWLAAEDIVADAALVSAARRARQTWVRVADAAGWDVQPSIERELYGADEYDVLGMIRQVEDVDTLAVIGHNPTMHSLVALLDDGEGDADARMEVATSFPTSAIAAFEVAVPWSEVGPGTATLRSLHVGRS